MSKGPTLLTGVKRGESDYLTDDLMEWERKFETANLENHKQFLRDAHLTVDNHPMEAAAWEKKDMSQKLKVYRLISSTLEFRAHCPL